MPEFSLHVQHGDPSDLWRSLQMENLGTPDLILEYHQTKPPPGTFAFIVTTIAATVTTLAAVAKLAHFLHGWVAGKEKTVVELEDKGTGNKLKITRRMTRKEVEDACADFYAAAQRDRGNDPPSLPPA